MLEHLVARLGFEDVSYVLPASEGSGWYEGRYFDTRAENEPAIDDALEAVEAAVAGLVAADMPTDRIVLAGFSQGACVLADFLALRPRPYAGVALLTGSLLGPDGHMTPVRPLGGVPVFMCSSEYDDWVEPARVRATAAALEEAGGAVTLRITSDREHEISDEAVAGVRELLRGVPSRDAPA
jgi:phospholipase/carboxylesterase